MVFQDFLTSVLFILGSKYTNQTNQSVANSSYCRDTGFSSYALWYAYNTYTITMNVDTTTCNLNETRLYFTSLGGSGNHYIVQSYNAIYSATIGSFDVYATSIVGWNASVLLSQASAYAWNLNWFGMFHSKFKYMIIFLILKNYYNSIIHM